MVDLRTGKHFNVVTEDEDTEGVQVVALPGALVYTGGGVTARFTDGRKETLSTDPSATGLASSGARVYWQAAGAVHTALLTLPAGDPHARARGCARSANASRARVRGSSSGTTPWSCSAGERERVGVPRRQDPQGR